MLNSPRQNCHRRHRKLYLSQAQETYHTTSEWRNISHLERKLDMQACQETFQNKKVLLLKPQEAYSPHRNLLKHNLSRGTPSCPVLVGGYPILSCPGGGGRGGLPHLFMAGVSPWRDLWPVEVLWDGDWGTPWKDMAPVEVLWDGDRVPLEGDVTSGSIMGRRWGTPSEGHVTSGSFMGMELETVWTYWKYYLPSSFGCGR